MADSCASSGPVLWKVIERWANCVTILIHKKRDGSECTNSWGISLSLPGNVCAQCLQKLRSKIIETKLDDTYCSFHPRRSTTDQIFTLHQIFEKSLGMPKASTHVLLTSRKLTTGFLVKRFGECFGSKVLMTPC